MAFFGDLQRSLAVRLLSGHPVLLSNQESPPGKAVSALSCWTSILQFSHHATAMGGGWLSW